jgi:hypothetical protein
MYAAPVTSVPSETSVTYGTCTHRGGHRVAQPSEDSGEGSGEDNGENNGEDSGENN